MTSFARSSWRSAEADFNVAVSLCEAGRVLEGKEILAKLIARQPDEPQTRYWMAFAHACLSAQTPEDATPALEALERVQPDAPQTIVLRGVLAWALGDMDTCAKAFHEAERIAPNDPVTQTYLGRLYLRQRQWPEAERAFRRALDVDPDMAEAHYGLSVALPRQNSCRGGNRSRVAGCRSAPRISRGAFSARRVAFTIGLVRAGGASVRDFAAHAPGFCFGAPLSFAHLRPNRPLRCGQSSPRGSGAPSCDARAAAIRRLA